jgi:hypothetical protein
MTPSMAAGLNHNWAVMVGEGRHARSVPKGAGRSGLYKTIFWVLIV